MIEPLRTLIRPTLVKGNRRDKQCLNALLLTVPKNGKVAPFLTRICLQNVGNKSKCESTG